MNKTFCNPKKKAKVKFVRAIKIFFMIIIAMFFKSKNVQAKASEGDVQKFNDKKTCMFIGAMIFAQRKEATNKLTNINENNKSVSNES